MGERSPIDLMRQTRCQVPVQLPLQVRLTPERGTVIWLDGFRRFRGALAFESWLLTERRDPSLAFADPVPDPDEYAKDVDRLDVVVTVDGCEKRASRGEVATNGGGWSADGRSEGVWQVAVPDDVRDVRIRLECPTLPLHRIIELDCDMLRSALDDVWEL